MVRYQDRLARRLLDDRLKRLQLLVMQIPAGALIIVNCTGGALQAL